MEYAWVFHSDFSVNMKVVYFTVKICYLDTLFSTNISFVCN